MKKLYEVLESKTDIEIADLAKELFQLDEDGHLPKDGKVKDLMRENPDYNLMAIRNEIIWDSTRRFVKLVK